MSTTSQSGSPKCPVCEEEVPKPGDFCSERCWVHWHVVIEEKGIDIVEVEGYTDLEGQSWYNQTP